MTKKEIYNKAFEIVEEKREKAIKFAEHNKQLAMQNKNFTDLDFAERALNMEIGKLKFEGQDTIKQVKKLNELKQIKQDILKDLGLTELDLIPNFDCKKCNDTGICQNEICSCLSQIANNLIMKNCGVDLSKVPDFADYDFKFFDDEKEREFAKKCVKKLTEYANNLNITELKNVVMCGASGTGKTYLTRCLAKEEVEKNYTTLFLSAFDLNNMFLEEHLASGNQKDHLKDLIDVDCLVIDDLGTEPIRKNVTKEYLLLLLNERLTKNKSTIITSNLNPEQILFKYEERIFSRIFNKRNSLILQFIGKNNRLKK